MKLDKLTIGIVLLLVASSVGARQETVLICHVGNETGPNGETYLDDPSCVPSDLNGHFCPDAGKIDLIVVAERAAANHLDNPSHYWDGISDYDPIAMEASGEGTEDSDGNGIDDGCEIPAECPCWSVAELQAITAENIYMPYFLSCDPAVYPSVVEIFSNGGGFRWQAYSYPGNYLCWDQSMYPYGWQYITPAEADICVSQLAKRCADIGWPLPPN